MISVVLKATATGNQRISQFMIQARRADPAENNDQAIGFFSASPSGTRVECTTHRGVSLNRSI